jgi:general nucleoside transport system permease protein
MTEPRAEVLTEQWWMVALRKAGVPLLSALAAMLVGSIIIKVSGYDPVEAYRALLQGAFGGPMQIGETIMRSTPLIFTGLAVAYGFRANLFNIGAEGQLFMGALAAAYFGLLLGGWPTWASLPAIIVLGALAGAAWAFIPALLKAKVGAHEVITTMMFSWIALYTVSWLVNGPIRGSSEIPQTKLLPQSAWFPTFDQLIPGVPPSRAHLGFAVAVVLAIVVWLVLKYTTLGFHTRAVGFNPSAAENGGISIASTTIKALCISGALAGLAGVSEVLGVQHRLFDQFSSGFGFTGIAVALLAKNHPIGVIFAAMLFGALSAGASTMQLVANVPSRLIDIIQALIIFFVAAEEIVNVLIKRRQKRAVEEAVQNA